ncbi:MAG TPA: hypothetical protein VHQ45_06420 [Gemmatimonadaceae bacterium]|nr:hypothetical protein [Gemmatimonadaceae bacterium]
MAVFGLVRYGTPINPLTFGTFYETVVPTLGSGLIAYALLPLADYSAADMVRTTAISGLHLLGVTTPYLFRGRGPSDVFGGAMRLLGLSSPRLVGHFSGAKLLLLLAGAVLSFAALALTSGGGMLWVTDSRTAYLTYRTGAGHFWLLSAWFLITALLYLLWGTRPRGVRLVTIALAFAAGAYFTGSKGIILSVFVAVIVYRNFLIQPFSLPALITFGVGGLLAFAGLLLLQGSIGSLLSVIAYFEHFDITTRFLQRFDEFGFRHGTAWLSSLWFYVPRALFPGKPLEYGATLIQEGLIPGAFADGYAPGFLPWSLNYLDFGLIGVFVGGYLKGLLQRAAFEHFLRNRQSVFAALIMLQIALWGVLAYATLGITIMWSIVQAIFFRLVLVSAPTYPAQTAAAPDTR